MAGPCEDLPTTLHTLCITILASEFVSRHFLALSKLEVNQSRWGLAETPCAGHIDVVLCK